MGRFPSGCHFSFRPEVDEWAQGYVPSNQGRDNPCGYPRYDDLEHPDPGKFVIFVRPRYKQQRRRQGGEHQYKKDVVHNDFVALRMPKAP